MHQAVWPAVPLLPRRGPEIYAWGELCLGMQVSSLLTSQQDLLVQGT